MTEKNKSNIRLSLIAVGLGLLVGIVINLITGRSPIVMIAALIEGLTGLDMGSWTYNISNIGELINQATPIILTGLAVGFGMRTGSFNIGAEGQLMMGALFASLTAAFVRAPAFIHLPLCILAALLGGAIWGAIPGFLKARFRVHEVVVTIMLNYTALYLSNYTILNIIGTTDKVKTRPYPVTASLQSDFLKSLFDGLQNNWGILIAIAAVFVYWFIINKTAFGYGLRAVGFNKDAARYAGIKVERNIVLSMTISGAFAGLAGAVITLGTFNFGRYLSAFEGYGMDGIAVSLVGANEAFGILLSGLLFGLLKSAQRLMQLGGIPKEITGIISSSIVLFVAMKYGIETFGDRIKGSAIVTGIKKRLAKPKAASGEVRK